MNICFCTARLPFPPIAGGRVETFRLIQGLVEAGHDVTVVAAGNSETAEEMAAATGASVWTVEDTMARSTGQLVRNLVSLEPLPIMKFKESAYRNTVEEVLASSSFDVLHLHTLQTSFLARLIEDPIPRVVRFTNIKSLIFRQFASRASNPAKAAYAYFQYLKTKRYERQITDHADVTLAITNEDRDFLSGPGASGRVKTLPAGIDLSAFTASTTDGSDETDGPVITFFGSMDYHPNADAAVWFAEEIWPQLRDRYPDSSVELVGKSPPESVETLADDPRVTVTGFVDDITEWVDRATVVVIPIRVGTGVRIKILHAMAMGKPIVSTSSGIQGIEIEDDQHARVRDNPKEFAAAVGELLDDQTTRMALGRRAREFVQDAHGYESICNELVATYQEVQ